MTITGNKNKTLKPQGNRIFSSRHVLKTYTGYSGFPHVLEILEVLEMHWALEYLLAYGFW